MQVSEMEEIFKNLPIEVKDIRALPGGDTNEAYKILGQDEPYFLLIHPGGSEGFFDGEAKGLELFNENNIAAPRLIDKGLVDDKAYLLISYLEEGPVGSMGDLARLMKELHQIESPNGKFGFDFPYESDHIKFTNAYVDTWTELFIGQRMDVLSKSLIKKGLWQNQDKLLYHNIRRIMERVLGERKSQPHLLHGDFYSGNYMFLEDKSPAIFDPNPLYGDYEFDIGISMAFAPLGRDFYNEYFKTIKRDKNLPLRLEFYRLYFYMIHLNKFGKVYKNLVDESIYKILKSS